MDRDRRAKDDVFYGVVLFAMRAAVVFHAAAGFIANDATPGSDPAAQPRAVMAAVAARVSA